MPSGRDELTKAVETLSKKLEPLKKDDGVVPAIPRVRFRQREPDQK